VAILAETVLVTKVLALHDTGRKRVRGSVWAVPFRHGGQADPEGAARRALATNAVMMTPNSVVIGIDPDDDVMLIHQLTPERRR
jgi:multisubunit Na+/H+ antiporter MnhE subunit